jgi:membrane-associated phospholipid phosphatase
VSSLIRTILFAGGAILTAGAAARADVVTEWNAAALDAIRANRMSPPQASRALAIVHVSIYDAVNGIVRSHEPYRVASGVPASASIEAAASAAAHVTLEALFPALSERFDRLHAAILATIPDGPHKRAGIAWGEDVGHVILDSRANDNADAIVAVPAGHAPGQWQPTPPAFASYLLPQWGLVTPFAMPASSFARPPGPPALDSARWAEDYNEIKALGAAAGSSRTPEQSVIALFWADGAGTETPPGHWNHIAQSVSASRGTSLADDARLFALLNIALADAGICAWDAKYVYDFWRPVTAIRNGDEDGNPATVADGSWSSFIVTPPFPDYVSGHSAFSGAAATVLAAFFGTDRVSFTAESDALPGVERRFTSFRAAAAEAALSRLYGGIHFRSANEDGLAAGLEVGEWAVTHVLLPKTNRSRR